MADRVRLVSNVNGVVAGDAELLALARRYGVTVVAHQLKAPNHKSLEPFELTAIVQN
jgi:hypothetical protein